MHVEELGPLTVRIAGGTDREGAGVTAPPSCPAARLRRSRRRPRLAPSRAARTSGARAGCSPRRPCRSPPSACPAGRAWWMIDIARFQQARSPRGGREPHGRGALAGLAAAREAVIAMLDALDAKLRPSKVVLGGFSQGAMLAVDVALRTERPLAGLVAMSGALIAASEWRALAPKRAGIGRRPEPRDARCHPAVHGGREAPRRPEGRRAVTHLGAVRRAGTRSPGRSSTPWGSFLETRLGTLGKTRPA
jgi:phospholipase/carboxylesterase